ncbi:MAG: TetR family transcriptional regulator [Deltaproteobacteria bacterium]|nr:MAG: TetR family transcriptional regulator [Deltaproteobacteria bacterium]
MVSVVMTSIEDQELIQKRREQIVKAATELFGSKSYNGTTMKEISKRAGFSSGLIYFYVKTKEDVLFLVLKNIIDGYNKEVPNALLTVEHDIDKFCVAVKTYCDVVDKNIQATLLAYRSTKDLSPERRAEIMELEHETNSLVAGCVENCIEKGFFRGVDISLTTYQVVMLAHEWALKSWHLRKKMSLAEYTENILSLFLHGLLTDAGRAALNNTTFAKTIFENEK